MEFFENWKDVSAPSSRATFKWFKVFKSQYRTNNRVRSSVTCTAGRLIKKNGMCPCVCALNKKLKNNGEAYLIVAVAQQCQ